MSVDRNDILRKLRAEFGDTVTRADLLTFKERHAIGFPYWLTDDKANQISRGLYRVPEASADTSTGTLRDVAESSSVVDEDDVLTENDVVPVLASATEKSTFPMGDDMMKRMERLKKDASLMSRVPTRDGAFVPFGDYDMELAVIQSRQFCPIFKTGPSGNGKTWGIEQACAEAKREYIRANITIETDEDDLIGGFRLKDGNTVFEPGPVLIAMLRGAVLLLDEIDLASPKIMILQPVLEGKPILVKKLGLVITPSPGFTIFATANTKGRGSEDGKYIGTGLLNEAFLERFPFTIEQAYPDKDVEKQILKKAYESVGGKTDGTVLAFFDTLAKWADGIRVTYAEGGIEDIITTRRLVHIAKAYHMFTPKYGPVDSQMWAMHFCTSRFDAKTKDSMVDYYNKLAPDASAPENVGTKFDGAKINQPPI
jgi:hypothetical protein